MAERVGLGMETESWLELTQVIYSLLALVFLPEELISSSFRGLRGEVNQELLLKPFFFYGLGVNVSTLFYVTMP